MAYTYTHFIPQNTAPSGAKRIGVYDGDGNLVCTIPLGKLTPTTKEKAYSFGIVADCHLENYRSDTISSYDKFDLALAFFKENGCSFATHCGDLADYGFWYPSNTYQVSTYDPSSYEAYRRICEDNNMPVYGCCGNHESYNGYDISKTYTDTYGANPSLVINNLEKLQEYTGDGLHFAKAHENDVFIFLGQPTGNKPMSDEALQWLYETLETNRNKRCFIYVHPHISNGNPNGMITSLDLFDNWGTKKTAFESLLRHYKNTIVFHGHTHVAFECQEADEGTIYTEKDGYRSVSVPSSCKPRYIVNGTLDTNYNKSQGILVDVYNDCIVLNGVDFVNNEYVPIGTYKIDTTLQTIEANTFTDSTGIITT